MPDARPSPPVPDADSGPFWQGLRGHRLLLQKCSDCEQVRFPPMPGCPRCASPASTLISADGSGRVYSWIVVHRPFSGIAAADLPCVIATVELTEGCRVLGRLALPAETAVRMDLAVRARYTDHEDWTELGFEPAVNP